MTTPKPTWPPRLEAAQDLARRWGKKSPTGRTEIYCPGFPVLVSDEAKPIPPGGLSHTESRLDSAAPSIEPMCLPTGALLASSSFPTLSQQLRRPSKQQLSSGSEGATSDLIRAGAATDASTSWGSPGSSATQSLYATARASARTVAARAAAAAAEAGYRAPSGTPPHPSSAEDRPSDFAPEDYCEDDIPQNVSIGDRIEGIRACLEARLGTHRFQKLYQSLSAAAVVDGTDGAAVQELGLSDELKEDLGSLALVAKLVDCEQRYFS